MTNWPILIELGLFGGLVWLLFRSSKRLEREIAEDRRKKAASEKPAEDTPPQA